MSNAELESLIIAYLEGTASAVQVVRLRNAIQDSGELRQRFHARVRLHKAQLAYLRSRSDFNARSAVAGLAVFAQRMGRIFAHVSVLALVFVQLRVTLPIEHAGLMLYVEDALAEAASAESSLSGMENLPRLVLSELTESDMPDTSMALPPLTLPELVMPVEVPAQNEA